jgi:HEAT repeat protein
MHARVHQHWFALCALLLPAQIAQATPTDAKAKPAAPAAAPVAAPATAAPAPAARPAPPANALRAAEEKLASADPAVVRQAIETAAQIGGEPAAVAISARLRRGLPPQLIESAIDALARIGKPSAGPVLIELTLHRRAQVRKRAVDALGALQIRSAQAVLLYALDDPSADVREAAVQSLARTGTARALPALFVAADRGMASAIVAVGRIATARDVKAILQRAKDGDVTRIKPALQVMLERSDFPVQAKVAIVRELALLGSAGARNHLVQWLDAWKASGDPRLRQALFDAIKRLDREQPAEAGGEKPAPPARPEVASANGTLRGAKP